MKKLYFLIVVLFIKINSQIKENPIFLVASKNPFVLSTNDDYFYLITIGKNVKIQKESGIIIENTDNDAIRTDYIFIADNSYIYYDDIYYKIIYNPFLSYDEIEIPQNSEYRQMKSVGCVLNNNNNDIIIYGYYENDYLVFSTNLGGYSYSEITNIKNYKLICKFIESENFVCAIIIDSKLELYCLKHHINPSDSSQNSLTLYENTEPSSFDSISSFGLYDTDKNNIKLLCVQRREEIICIFIDIAITDKSSYTKIEAQNLIFTPSNAFTEKNCYFSVFNNEYLICCVITDYIKCYRINSDDYQIIKEFKIKMTGDNSFLTIKSFDDYSTFFFMNGENSVYEYYIYLPKCENKNYALLNSLNENKPEERWEKLLIQLREATDKRKGKPLSDEHKRKLSESHKGIRSGCKLSDETKAKISKANSLENISEETRKRKSLGHMKKVKVTNVGTGEVLIFNSHQEAAKYFGVKDSAVSRWINKTRNAPNNYIFENYSPTTTERVEVA